MNIVNLAYRSTNYYALEIAGGKLLVDCGWPGMFPEFLSVFNRKGVRPEEIRYILVTHFHMDHAGAVQEMKERGAKLLLLESQEEFVAPLGEYLTSKAMPHLDILPGGNIHLKFEEARKFLAGVGLSGEILPTPGHSPDHVSLILDDGAGFTGDLPPRELAMDEVTLASWDRLYQHGLRRIYPAHGPEREA
jgi:endoribonuclease LACTB2